MSLLRHMSIQRKLMMIVAGTSGIALLLACIAFLVYDQRSFRNALEKNLATQAEIAGNLNAAYLAGAQVSRESFAQDAAANLAQVRIPNLVAARFFLPDGSLFVAHPPGAPESSAVKVQGETQARVVYSPGRIHAIYPVRQKGQLQGFIELESNLDGLRDRMWEFIPVLATVLGLATAVALLLFYLMHQAVTGPVLHLTEVASGVATRRDYGVRAVKAGDDELGRLVDCFNDMLAQIQQRDQGLQKARNELERRVQERTAEVSKAHDQLKLEMIERSKLEGQLRQAQKMEAIGQLAGGVAHDFNNILTVVLGHTALLLGSENLPQDIEEPLKEIDSSARRASNLTRQLLTFSRRQMVRLSAVNLNHVLSNVAKLLQRLLGEHVSLAFRFAPELPMVHADTTMLEQVVINLAVNARDAMPGGGEIIVTTSLVAVGPAQVARNPDARPGRFVCLEVTDTGCGMDEATLQRLFEPFFTTKPQGKGTGLGLATVYGIVRQHEGWIDLRSQPGRGTTFWVYLPAVMMAEASKPDTRFWGGARGGSETILVVEDEDAVRSFVSLCLRRYGYQVIEARNGKHALNVWDECRERVDLLLTDLVMPEGVSGGELAARLTDEKPGLPVIYSSGYSDLAVHGGLDLQESVNYLPKPYDPVRLIKIVRGCLDTRAKGCAAP